MTPLKIPHIMLFLVSMMFAKSSSEDPCAPQCLQPNTNTTDPRDCYQYYYCYADLTPSETPLRCGTGTHFGNGFCTESGECEILCPPCHLTCDASVPFDTIADVSDCSVSYSCESDGVGMTFTCPENMPYYDSVTKQCSADSAVCCNPGCVPHCYGNMIRTADPTDCTRYYTCLEGVVGLLIDCPVGESFDLPTGLCKAGAKCNEWCNSGGVIGSSTTTTTITPKPAGCVGTLLCQEIGSFPQCPDECYPIFFICTEIGQQGIPVACDSGLLFNPVPEYPYCVTPDQCPYTPPVPKVFD